LTDGPQPQAATPHRLILLADPQIIDPHTYPGRPWPLSTFTFLHTDNYLARSYIQLSKVLRPDTVFFLGDLFDGARDWKTGTGESADPAWAEGRRPKDEAKQYPYWRKHYGEDFWLKEYDRFGRIFFKHWNDGSSEARNGQRGKKIIASLPGNHDIGFGPLVKVPVRNRFEAYFGETNRVDVIGNHTFVSVDGLSLSARSDDNGTPEIYRPVEEFLKNVQATKRRAVERELRLLDGKPGELTQKHVVEDLHHADFTFLPTLDPGPRAPTFPTILLTHVPLYRAPDTPCGPYREHWPPATPPAGQTTPVNPDARNAISISRGWQYQNVLGETDSINLVKDVGDIISVFSGDDHDYCELTHGEDKQNVKEITVKSMSYAMGVKKPGFLMVSMWNPVDAAGRSIGTHGSGHGATGGTKATTIETHLCLLPNQLAVLLKYLMLLCVTLIALIIRAILVPILNLKQFSPLKSANSSDNLNHFLAMSNKENINNSPYRQEPQQFSSRLSNSSTSSTSSNGQQSLAPRSTANRTRSVSPGPSYGYGLPPSQPQGISRTPPTGNYAMRSGNGYGNGYVNGNGNDLLDYGGGKRNDDYDAGDEEAEWGRDRARERRAVRPSTKAEIAFREAWTGIWRVTWVVSLLYLWAIWKW
jgi:hypothetical protein